MFAMKEMKPQPNLRQNSPNPRLARKCTKNCPLEEDKPLLQRRASTPTPAANEAPPIVHEVLRSPGQPLDESTRSFMEPRFNQDFGHVRIHTDAKAAESAHAVNALAYTVGRDIVMKRDEYAPATDAGKRLLAHELVHVIQQGGNNRLQKLQVGAAGDVYEQEADRVAERVVGGGLVGERWGSRSGTYPNPNSIAHLQRTIGNQAVHRLLEKNQDEVKGELVGAQTAHLGHDFSRIPVHAPPARATATRNVDGSVSEDEVVTNNGTPAQAPGVFPPTPPLPAASSGQCHVTSGPTYTPSSTIPVTTTGGRKSATFSMAATFGTAYVTVPPRKPSCCEVRQYIKWDEAFHTWQGGPPHSGFPSSATAGTWYEDRSTRDKRYGHRSGVHSDPIAGCIDEYLTGGIRDQANGDTYCGRDTPNGPSAMTGQFQFQLKVIDTCNGNAEKAISSIITINW